MSALPRLTAISRLDSLGETDFAGWIDNLARSGVDAVQIREKELPDLELFELVSRAVELMAGRGRVLVSGRADIALAAGADGVHLPSDGLPVESIRRLVGRSFLVGLSTHSVTEIARAREAGVDYVYYSPIFDTPGKAAIGLEELARAARQGVPVIALGGITIDRLPAVAEAGAVGAAAIRMFDDPAEIPSVVAAAERAFER